MKKAIIYLYTNIINNKVYVGQTFNEGTRYSAHKNSPKHIGQKNVFRSYFHEAIAKYGFENFKYEVIYELEYEDSYIDLVKKALDSLEIYLIKKYNSNDPAYGYNLTEGGGGTIGFKMSEEHKKKISEALKAKNMHWNDNQRNAIKNRKVPEHHSGKKILKYSLEGEFLEEFSSLSFASESVNGHPNALSVALKRDRNKGLYKNYYWIYKESDNIQQSIEVPKKEVKCNKKVKQYSLDGTLIKEWDSLSDIARRQGKCLSTISDGIKRNPNNYLGYKWEVITT